MASVFLSYDRDDTERARPIALALERASHAVWWDLHIRVGEQYTRAIDQALNAADAVVVLWSKYSVESAWVRDEAAVGRDSGRLIPVSLDDTAPPLGFRQFQTIDLSGWKGRGKPPHLGELLGSIDLLAGEHETFPPPPAAVSKKRSNLHVVAGLATASVAIAAAAFVAMRPSSGGAIQTVAVVASEPSAKPLAHDLLANLGNLQSAKSGSMRLIGDEGGSGPKADLIFEAANDPGSARPSASLLLKAGTDNSLIWSKDFQQESGSFADLEQQMAFTAARVLGCALETRDTGGRGLSQQTLKTYLNACAQLSGIGAVDASTVVDGLLQVTREEPRFKGGWAKLLTAEAQTLDAALEPDEAAREILRHHIEAARRVDPAMAAISLAEAAEIGNESYVKRGMLLDRAKAAHPDDPEVLGARSNFLYRVGRMREAIDDAGRAVELDPLSPQRRNEYVSALMYGGRIDDARKELQAAERLWPGTEALREIQLRFNLRYGDPKAAAALAVGRRGGPGLDLYLRARSNPTPENVRLLTTYEPRNALYGAIALSNRVQALAEFHREDELFALVFQPKYRSNLADIASVSFRPAFKKFREDRRFMQLAARAGLVEYWRTSGKWPDFCLEPGLPYDCKKEAAKLIA